MLFRYPRNDVMLDINEWHKDSLGSTAEISLFIWFSNLLHLDSAFSFVLELLALDFTDIVGVFWTVIGVEMSFFAENFFLFERLLAEGGLAGTAAFLTALIIGA